MTETIFANARLVLPDEVVPGSLVVRDGVIAALDQGTQVPTGAIDLGGDHLAPGLVELHTDNLERHLQPRPKVNWPLPAAIMAHDAELASVGITTVFDALRAGSLPSEGRGDYKKYARPTATAIIEARAKGWLKISHFLHIRAEMCSETLVEELAEFTPDDRIGIVSLMDHTPGQRQFSDVAQFRNYLRGKWGMTDDFLDGYFQRLLDLSARVLPTHQKAAVAAGERLGAVLASHDDTKVDDVATSAVQGCTVAEFPTTLAAAQACRDHGIRIIMGAPNYLRGGSHSGNVAAGALAEAGLLDILSSDYAPSSLLMAAVRLGRAQGNLARGMATVTQAPAAAVNLTDRGALEVGRRADLIRFQAEEDFPVLRQVWSRGQVV